jgi:hypothetical protein
VRGGGVGQTNQWDHVDTSIKPRFLVNLPANSKSSILLQVSTSKSAGP